METSALGTDFSPIGKSDSSFLWPVIFILAISAIVIFIAYRYFFD